MPQPTKPGEPIRRARLSAAYDPVRGGKLTHQQASLARKIIRRMVRDDDKGRVAYTPNAIRLPTGHLKATVREGSITITDAEKVIFSGSILRPTASVGEVVAESVYRGLWYSGNDTPYSENDPHDAEAGAEGDAESDARGDGEDDGTEDYGTENDAEGAAGEGDGEGVQADESDRQPDKRPKPNREHDIDYLLQRLAEIREYLNSPEAEVDAGDTVSNVPYKMGARMLRAGIPVRAILHAYAISWPESAREQAGIEPYDPREFGKAPPGRHELYPYLRRLIEADVPVYLKGPTQSGKSYVLQQIAEDMGLPFRTAPLTGGASTTWLLGGVAPPPIGVIEAGFPEMYGGNGDHDGGIFLFDEVDAADPNMTIVLNNALANNELENPKLGKRYSRARHFRPVAAGNTWGKGADSDYSGRKRQDKALLERFRVGRVAYDYDTDLQERIARSEYENAVILGETPDPPPAESGEGKKTMTIEEFLAALGDS